MGVSATSGVGADVARGRDARGLVVVTEIGVALRLTSSCGKRFFAHSTALRARSLFGLMTSARLAHSNADFGSETAVRISHGSSASGARRAA